MNILCNSQGTKSRDPHVTKHKGYYYWTYTFENRIYIVKSDSIAGLATEEGVLVWTPESAAYSQEVWAPELHILDNTCYLYVACDDGNNCNHRMYVLSNGGSNPMETYHTVGKISDPTDKWAIDGTVFHHQGNRYFLWSGWEGDVNIAQNIYIAKMKSPAELEGERVLISRPEYDWEKLGGVGTPGGRPFINEGPYAFSVEGRVFVAYSAAGSWCVDYSIALLELTGKDPMDPNAWKKHNRPVLSQNDQFVGMGHCSVLEEEKKIFFHGWRADETQIISHTVYPICADYCMDGGKLIIV